MNWCVVHARHTGTDEVDPAGGDRNRVRASVFCRLSGYGPIDQFVQLVRDDGAANPTPALGARAHRPSAAGFDRTTPLPGYDLVSGSFPLNPYRFSSSHHLLRGWNDHKNNEVRSGPQFSDSVVRCNLRQ